MTGFIVMVSPLRCETFVLGPGHERDWTTSVSSGMPRTLAGLDPLGC